MSLHLKAAVLAMRPKQWTKNVIVLAALVFALGDRHVRAQLDSQLQGFFEYPALAYLALALTAVGAALIFCLVSSAVYLMNDLHDIEQDRLHPVKKERPIASGALPVRFARTLCGVLVVVGLFAAWRINMNFFLVTTGYFLIQILYTFSLKRIALVDIFIISGGFVLRALAGAVAINVEISPWLLLCTLLLSLFLALCKRRHELVVVADAGGESRASLRQYNEKVLDQLIAMMGGTTIVCYALYTLSTETVAKFGTAKLGFTIPFVIFGVARYLDNVYRKDLGGRPEQILLTDRALLVDIALYVATVGVIFFWR